jgi:hypothetical protein
MRPPRTSSSGFNRDSPRHRAQEKRAAVNVMPA